MLAVTSQLYGFQNGPKAWFTAATSRYHHIYIWIGLQDVANNKLSALKTADIPFAAMM